MKITKRVLIVASMAFMALMLYQWGHVDGREGKSSGIISESIAAESPPKASPVKARARDFYAPNSEDLEPDEMRLIACGTGMPTARPGQAASCWLLELGNGDKFIFDIGSMPAAVQAITYLIPARYFVAILQTVFLAGDVWPVILPNALALMIMAMGFIGLTRKKTHKRLD